MKDTVHVIDLLWSIDMIPNLASEALGVVAELFLVYFVIDLALRKREAKKWKPVRTRVASQCLDIYQRVCMLLLMVMPDPSDDDQVSRKLNAANYLLRELDMKLPELVHSVDLNAVGLSADLLPTISSFVEEARQAIDEARFFLSLYDSKHAGETIAGEPAFRHLIPMERTATSLAKQFPSAVSEQPHVFIDQIERAWHLVASRNPRLHLSLQDIPAGSTVLLYSGRIVANASFQAPEPGFQVRTFRP